MEQEKKPEPNAKEQYKELKKTELYDAEKNQWNFSMDENENITNAMRDTYDQLLGVLVESRMNKTSIREPFEKLRETQLFDSRKKRWNLGVNKNQRVLSGLCFTNNELLAIFIESQFDGGLAESKYKTLKNTPLYEKQNEKWEYRLDIRNPSCQAETQLLGILVESQFNKERAKELYDALKETSFYDDERKQWNNIVNENQIEDNARETRTKLIGTLVESQFDKDSARALYNDLKRTALYNTKEKLWYYGMKNGIYDPNSPFYHASTQLLGILCEQEFEENKPDLNTTPPLPEERKF